MSSEWVKFTDLLSAIVDNRGRTCPVGSFGTPLIATNCISNSSLYPSYDTMRFVSEETYQTWFRGYPIPGDILFVCKGSPGRTNWVPDPVDFCIAQDMVAVRADPAKIYPKYLFAALRSESVQAQISNLHVGTMIPHFKKGDFDKLLIPLPEVSVQIEVGDLYFEMSERINLLRETNATLEAITQALFKSWFVDFDPVRAKMAGRAPEGMDEATAALFPDALVETQFGVVPERWQPERVDSFIELAYGKALKAEKRRPGAVPVYGSGGITGWHDEALVHEPSIIVGRKGTVGSLYWESRPFYPIDTVFYVKSERPLSYCYQLLKTLGLNDMNTDAAVPGLNRENVYRLLVPHPPEAVINAFDETARALQRIIDHHAQQSNLLIELRDALLPRLISGQLRPPEAQAQLQLEEALA